MNEREKAPLFGSWQLIETAPTDGTEVRAFAHSGVFPGWVSAMHATRSRFIDGKWNGWFGDSQGWAPYAPQPTHWQPMPAPPEEKA